MQKPFGGRGSAPDATGELIALLQSPDPLAGGEGLAAPSPSKPASGFGLSGLATAVPNYLPTFKYPRTPQGR